jgi:hypothetical protein
MDANAGRHVLIHCAANFRVTAFYGLYAMHSLGWNEAQVDALRAGVWGESAYPVWEAFIAEMKARLTQAGSSTGTDTAGAER